MRSLALPALFSWVAGVVLTALVRRVAAGLDVFDRPDGIRKLQPGPVPLLGGIAVFCGWIVALAFGNALAEPLVPALISAAAVALMVGVLDDIYSLRARWKLAGQACAAGVLVAGGMTVERFSVFGASVELGALGAVLAGVWLVGTMNAVNMLDGMDGLAATLSLLACLVVAGMACIGNNPALLIGAVGLAAALAGFLPFNLPPARVYLGDSGSTLLGLLLGAYTLQAARCGSAAVAIVLPVAVLIVPIFDCAAAIIRRRLRGVGLAMPDREHIHHRLLKRGWSRWQVLCRLGAVAALAGIAALPSLSLDNELIALAAASLLVLGFVAGKGFGYEEYLLLRLSVRRQLARLRGRKKRPAPRLFSFRSRRERTPAFRTEQPGRRSA